MALKGGSQQRVREDGIKVGNRREREREEEEEEEFFFCLIQE